jgi:hypothetical protein
MRFRQLRASAIACVVNVVTRKSQSKRLGNYTRAVPALGTCGRHAMPTARDSEGFDPVRLRLSSSWRSGYLTTRRPTM